MTVPSAVGSGEVDELAELLRVDAPHRVRGVLLTGAPGAGKSTTLEALGRRLHARGVDVRRVGADDVEGSRPFGAITDLLGLAPVYPPRPDTIDHLLGAIESLGQTGPTALCLDDAHRADPDSLEVFARLGRIALDLPVSVVLARRRVPARTPLALLGGRGDVVDVDVVGLRGRGLDDLIFGRYHAAAGPRLAALLADAEGNPFRVRTLLDQLDRRGVVVVKADTVDIPEGAEEVDASLEVGLRAHLGLLDPASRELLTALAAWGGAADLTTLAELRGGGPVGAAAAAQGAVEAGLLEWTANDRLAFTHDLYRDVVLADLDPNAARALHAACAETLRRQGAGPLPVARQTAQSAGPDTLAALTTATADLEHAPLHAADLLSEAATHVAEDDEAADLIAVERAGALAVAGRVDDAEQVARDRLALSRDPGTHAALHAVLLFCLVSSAQVDAALAEIDATTARAPSPDARQALAEVRRWVILLAGRRSLTGPPATEASSGSGLISDAIELFLTAHPVAALERATEAAAARIHHRSRPWLDSPTATVWPPFLALHVHGPARARALSLEARRDAQRKGRLWLTPYHQSVSAGINYLGGAWDDALAELESGLEAAEATGTAWTSLTTATLLQILTRRGDLPTARDALRGWRLRALPEQFGLPQIAHAEVLLLEAGDEVGAAAELAYRSWQRALGLGRTVWPLIAGPDTLRVARSAGHAELAACVERDTAAIPLAQTRADAPAALLVAAVAQSAPDQAAAAALDYRALGHVPGEMNGWEEAACLYAAAGHRDQARTAATRANTLAETVGARTTERRLAARLRRLDVRLGVRGARRRPESGWGSLTRTELQIAELVGRGMTSPQVAARLYISPRTVQSHLTRILRKLELRSRVELAAQLSRRRGSE